MDKSKGAFWCVVIAAILMLSIGPFLYFIQHGCKFSSNPTEWSAFAVFNGYFVSIASVIVLAYISYIAHKSTEYYNKLNIQPVLYSFVKPSIKWPGYDQWYIVNASKYPVMNVIVRYKYEEKETKKVTTQSKYIACSCLAGNTEEELFWMSGATTIDVYFTDITNRYYFKLQTEQYINSVISILKEEYQEVLEKAKNDNINVAMIHDAIWRDRDNIKDKVTFLESSIYTKTIVEKK